MPKAITRALNSPIWVNDLLCSGLNMNVIHLSVHLSRVNSLRMFHCLVCWIILVHC